MSFASWYSIFKNIPDAAVAVCLIRGKPVVDSFIWPYKCKVSFFQCKEDADPFECVNFGERKKISLNSSVVAVRSYEGNLDISSTKSDELTTFVDYSEGCGNFVMSEWINRLDAPFGKTVMLKNDNMTANEIAVFKLWERMHSFYASL
jgi:hypothetical protein